MYMYAKWRRLNIQLSISCNIVLFLNILKETFVQ